VQIRARQEPPDDGQDEGQLERPSAEAVHERKRPDGDPDLDHSRQGQVTDERGECQLTIDGHAGSEGEALLVGGDTRRSDVDGRRCDQKAERHGRAREGAIAPSDQQCDGDEKTQLRLQRQRAQGESRSEWPVGAEQGKAAGDSQGHEWAGLAELQDVDDRHPGDRGDQVDQSRAPATRRNQVPRPRNRTEEQEAPGPVGEVIREQRQREGEPRHRWRADEARQLRDLDARAERAQLLLLSHEVIDRLPAMAHPDPCGRVIEREVVVEVVGREGDQPLVHVEGREHRRRQRG